MGPASRQTRSRVFRCSRAEAISASSGQDQSTGAIGHLRGHGVDVELGPVRRSGARGEGTSVYFRDPDDSLLELISYA
jgi:catechol 2,3-dioxygenase-like lactoylglutathione lyase family enzyme